MSANSLFLSAALLMALPVVAEAEPVKYPAEIKVLGDGIYRGVSLTYTTTDKDELGAKYGHSTFITLSKKF